MRVDFSDNSPNHSRFLQSKKAANSFLCLRQQGREGGKKPPTRATYNFELSRYFFKSFVFPLWYTLCTAHSENNQIRTEKQVAATKNKRQMQSTNRAAIPVRAVSI